jgi:predicted type IV restriction endonuclease
MKIEVPSPVEQAAISNSETPEAKKRKKRTKLQIRRQSLSAIKKAIRPFHSRLTQMASQDRCSEEQVRVWCIDVLRNVLGYKDGEIDTEMYALNQRIDIALKRDDKVFMVIECKNTRSKLPVTAVNQAVAYAANKSADWAVVTSGQVWKLLRVFPVKGADPRVVEVFDLSLLDADGVSDDDVSNLFLLTSRSLFSGDTEKVHHRVACLSNRNVLDALATPRVVRALRRSLIEAYKKASKVGVKVSEDHVEDRVREMFLPADLSDPPPSRVDAVTKA